VDGPALEQVDRWLNGALRRADVHALRSEPFPEGAGQLSTVTRIAFDAPPGADLPRTMILKSASGSAEARQIADRLGTVERERCFYEAIAPALPPGLAPRCHGVVSDEAGSTHFLLEDLGAFREPPTGADLSAQEVRTVLSRIGEVHGRTWGHPALAQLPSPGTLDWMPEAYRTALPVFLEHFGDALAPDSRQVPERIADHFHDVIAALEEAASCVGDCACHGDLRAANLAFDPAGGVRLFDWGMTLRASGPFELGYLLPTACSPTTLRAREPDLLTHYADAVASAGGPTFAPAGLRRLVALGRLWFTVYPVVGAATTPRDNPESRRFFRWHTRRQFPSLEAVEAALASI
jgi:hypothetical protein